MFDLTAHANDLLRSMAAAQTMHTPGGLVGYSCPYCGTVYAKSRSESGTGGDIACCGEVGHCEAIKTFLDAVPA